MKNLTKRDARVFDAIIRAVDSVAKPEFYERINRRLKLSNDDAIFQELAVLCSYSGAKSKHVSEMIKSGALEKAFAGFKVREASKLDTENVINDHWDKIKVMRFKDKVKKIIKAARKIEEISKEYGSIEKYIKSFKIPKKVKNENALEKFWVNFDSLLTDLKKREVPIIKSQTTLLHFLDTWMDCDCHKPDVVVMRIAKNTGLVQSDGKGARRQMVKKVQEYCFDKEMNPRKVDGYLLAFGGQSDWTEFVKRSYCLKEGSCSAPECPVGKKGLCPTCFP